MEYIYKDWRGIGLSQNRRVVESTTTDGVSKTYKDCERLSPAVLVEHINDLLVPNRK
jgi:hypothetical protein